MSKRTLQMGLADGSVSSAEAAGLHRLRRLVIWLYAAMITFIVGGAAAGYFFGHPRPGHPRHLLTLFIVVGVVVVVTAASGALTWTLMSRHAPTRRLLQFSWRTRRRAVLALRKGRPISPEDQPAADAIIDATPQDNEVRPDVE